jgi:polysaccharide biosynthesis protein PslH
MNILFLTSRFPYPPHRGDKLKIFNLIRQLSRRHSITLLSFISSREEVAYVEDLGRYCADIRTVYLPPWRSVWNCGMNALSPQPFQVAYFASRAMRRALAELLARKKFDLVHIHLIRMAQYAAVPIPGSIRVLDLTDAGSLYLQRFLRTTTHPLKKLFLREEHRRLQSYERILDQFDINLVCSDVDRNALLHHAPGASIGILSNGIDLDYFTSNNDVSQNPYRIIFTGNMLYYPNTDGIVHFANEVFPIIRARVPKAELYIVGQAPPARVRKLAGADIVVTGFVPDIKEYYLQSAVAIAPIRFGAGTLNKILEPMALGIPVVSTPIGVEGLPVSSGRDLLVAESTADFAQAVVRLLEDPDLRQRIADSGQSIVRKLYDWKVIAGQLESYYSQVDRYKSMVP